MAATSVVVLIVLTFLYFLRDVSDDQRLREETLKASAAAISEALDSGKDPARLPLYRDYPWAYGFRVFDRPVLASRRVLASANTLWLPPIQYPASTATDPDGDRDRHALGTDLLEGFVPYLKDRRGASPKGPAGLLIRRVGRPDRHYWIQVYMIGDPAGARAGVIADDLSSHVLIPALFFIPSLALAIFLTTRAALRPLRRLSVSANRVGAAVARGQALSPIPEGGMAREFSEVAATINTMLEKLDHSLNLQKQFTSDIAHELRTPLAVLLLESSQIPAGPTRDRIKIDLKELGQLINELLRFAQAEDVLASEAREVDASVIARKVVEESVAEAVGRHQSIEFYCDPGGMVVSGNSSLIEIAIRNMVINALKYSPAYTVVSVRIESGPIVVVEDCGSGIPTEHRDNVFERFWRVEGQSASGAGVGLALVRRIAQLHDGSVRLEDRPGGGTRIILSLVRSGFAPVPVRAPVQRQRVRARLPQSTAA